MKKRLLKSLVYTAATVLIGLSSLAGAQIRHKSGKRGGRERGG